MALVAVSACAPTGGAADAAVCRTFDGGAAGPSVKRSEISAIIDASCAISSCHGNAPGGGRLHLPRSGTGDWYPNVVGFPATELPRMSRVSPGDPANSWLVHKVFGSHCKFDAECIDRSCRDPMPPTGDMLPATDVQKIIDWIRSGAPAT